MAMGPMGLNLNDPDLARALGFGALVVILAEGGLTTKWTDIRPSIGVAAVLATGRDRDQRGADDGLLLLRARPGPLDLGAPRGGHLADGRGRGVLGATQRPDPHRLRGALEAESGLNDAPTVLLVALASEAAISGLPADGALGVLGVVALIAIELIGGVLIGLGFGWLGVAILRRVALPSSGLYPLAALVWTVFTYAAGAKVHTSGFAAVYVCALMLGNAQLPHRAATRSFVEGIGWIAQIGLFVMLGLLAQPQLVTLQQAGIAITAGLFLTLVARPVSVLASATPFRIPLRQQAFLSWAGLRGAVPIVLATIPVSVGVADSALLFNVVLVFVVVFTCLQAPTLPFIAGKLGLIDRCRDP